MDRIRVPEPVNFERYAPALTAPERKYGLPAHVEFCRNCIISNQRPNSAIEYEHTKTTKKATIRFDDQGICDACRFTERKRHEIDWFERDRMLRDLCDKYRSHDGRYDCIVPGSGGKDSFYASHVLKTRYGMHPLTVTWAPHIYTNLGLEELPIVDPCRLR